MYENIKVRGHLSEFGKGMKKNGMDATNGIQREIFKGTIKSDKMKPLIKQKPPLPSAMIYRYTDWTNVSDPYRNRRMFMDMMTDTMFLAPAIHCANAFVNYSLTTYFYQLQYRADNNSIFGVGPIPSWIGAYHTADLVLVFGFPLRSDAHFFSTKDANFSRDIITLWTNFAKTGNPNQPESIPIVWPQYDINNQQYIALKPTMAIDAKLRAEYVAFWNDFIPEALRSLPKPEPCSDGTYNIITGMFVIIFALVASLLGIGF